MTHSHRALMASLVLFAVAAPSAAAPADPAPVVVVRAETALAASAPASDAQMPTAAEAFPAIQTGVRRAAQEGNDALRRYVWRTRMIYNFYFNDFARNE